MYNHQMQAMTEAKNANVQRILNENRSWVSKYKSLHEALNGNDPIKAELAKNTLIVMENQLRYMQTVARDKRMEATFTNALGTLVPKIMDVVRIFYPNLITHKLVDVQPMDRQNGQVVLVKPVYTQSAAGVTAGQQVFRNVTDGTYASERTTFSVGTGNAVLVTFTATLAPVPVRPGTLTVAAGAISGTPVVATYRYDSEQSYSEIRNLDIQITNLPITAEPHPIKVSWSQQSQFAAESHFDLDLGDMMSNLVASFIKQERDMLVINQILASAKVESTLNFDAAAPANYSKLARYAEIGVKLDYAESLIQADLGRGGVNWILCGNNAANVWSQVSGFKPSGVNAPIGPYEIGTLRDGTVSVVKVPTMSANDYVVGFKGYVVGDSSIVLGEWIPLYATPVFQAPDLYNAQGLMSLYATVVNQPLYFRKGTLSNFTA